MDNDGNDDNDVPPLVSKDEEDEEILDNELEETELDGPGSACLNPKNENAEGYISSRVS